VQIAKQEILRVVVSVDVHCCAIMNNIIVASQKRCCRCRKQGCHIGVFIANFKKLGHF